MPTHETITILGSGQMSLACAEILRENGITNPRIWSHDPEEAVQLAAERRSPRLPGVALPDDALVTASLPEALDRALFVVNAVPVQFIRSTWQRAREEGAAAEIAHVVSVSKGLERQTILRPLEVIREAAGPLAHNAAYTVLSGPTIAAELARKLPATMIAASQQHEAAERAQQLFTTSWLRVYTGTDPVGAELAGALKNVIALAAGMLDGLGMGFNAKSALLARGLAEIVRLGEALGAERHTFFGVAGVGDLATTCFCPEGRNRTCGEALGQGRSLDEHLRDTRSVVEGVATSESVATLAQQTGVDMPICAAVHAVLQQHMSPRDALASLMSREVREERVG